MTMKIAVWSLYREKSALLLPSALAGKVKQSVASVCLSVRPSVGPFVATLSFEPNDLWT